MIKCEIGNSKYEGRVPRRLEITQVLGSRDGFYEWSLVGKSKQPYCFEVNRGHLFAFAGLWDQWSEIGGKTIETCSILTTTANGVTSFAHDRMPVILERENYKRWLDPQMQDAHAASEMLRPYDSGVMRSYPVSMRINYVSNDDEECSRPVELVELQQPLFS